jgi:hypothetical protein
MTSKAKSFSVKFVEVLNARIAEQYSKDTVTANNNAANAHVALDLIMSKPEFAEIAKTLLKNARIADAKQDKQNFIGVKVLVKVVQALVGMGQGITREFDPYSQCIIENLIALNGISNKSALVSLSKSIAYDELEQQADLVKRYNCGASTASTQASSTRMMLKHLGLCDVQKGKCGDVTTLQENDRVKAMIALFAPSN